MAGSANGNFHHLCQFFPDWHEERMALRKPNLQGVLSANQGKGHPEWRFAQNFTHQKKIVLSHILSLHSLIHACSSFHLQVVSSSHSFIPFIHSFLPSCVHFMWIHSFILLSFILFIPFLSLRFPFFLPILFLSFLFIHAALLHTLLLSWFLLSFHLLPCRISHGRSIHDAATPKCFL